MSAARPAPVMPLSFEREPSPALPGATPSPLAGTRPSGLDEGALKNLRKRFQDTGRTKGREAGADAARRRADKILAKFFKLFGKGQHKQAALQALAAIETDPTCGLAHHAMALALEKLGELHKALQFFEKALDLDPTDPDLYYNLGNTAWRLNLLDGAARLFKLYIELCPEKSNGYNNLASVLRDQGRFDDALETVRAAIYTLPEEPHLWNTLGTILLERGDADESNTFFDEALRLHPDFAQALHNKAFTAFNLGDFETALTHWDKAESLCAHDRHRLAEIGHGVGHCLLAMGDLPAGWKAWQWRHDPAYRACTLFNIPAPRWTDEDLTGARVLAIAEQGIGDEIMFSNALPELIDAVGPEGTVMIAVEHRLVPLFRRTYPTLTVGPLKVGRHNGLLTRSVPWLAEAGGVDFYTPFGDTLIPFRPRIEDFPKDRQVLRAETGAVATWTERLAALGPAPKIGVCWRSGHMSAARSKFYCPVDYWGPVFEREGAIFINLQYDDSAADREHITQRFGAEVIDFDDLDLRNDLDGNAALCAALDLVLSAPTAAGGLAGAVGTPTWFVSNSTLWPTLGTNHYPWYAGSRFFAPDRFADWPSLMTRLGGALDDHLSQGAPALTRTAPHQATA